MAHQKVKKSTALRDERRKLRYDCRWARVLFPKLDRKIKLTVRTWSMWQGRLGLSNDSGLSKSPIICHYKDASNVVKQKNKKLHYILPTGMAKIKDGIIMLWFFQNKTGKLRKNLTQIITKLYLVFSGFGILLQSFGIFLTKIVIWYFQVLAF